MPSTIAEAVGAFRQYIENLKQRPDVLVMDGSYLGPPADAGLLRRLRETPDYRGNAGRLPADLLDLYELMNGAYVYWQYRQQPDNPNEEWNFSHQQGAIDIPPWMRIPVFSSMMPMNIPSLALMPLRCCLTSPSSNMASGW